MNLFAYVKFFRKQAKSKRGMRKRKKTNNGRDTTEMDHLKENDISENKHRVVPPTSKPYIKEEKYSGSDTHRSPFERAPVNEHVETHFASMG